MDPKDMGPGWALAPYPCPNSESQSTMSSGTEMSKGTYFISLSLKKIFSIVPSLISYRPSSET